MKNLNFLPKLLVAGFAALTLLGADVAAQTILTVDTTASRRIGDTSLVGVDYLFGTADAQTAAEGNQGANNNSLIGDNPTNLKFGQMWRFNATSDFVTDFDNGFDLELSFTSGLVNAGGGAPANVDIYFLANGAATTRSDAAGATPTFLGSVSGTTPNTLFSVGVTGITSLAVGDRIWFGLLAGLSNNSTANNIFIAGTSSTINAELAAVPEPTSAALLIAGLAGVLVARRQRRNAR